MAAEVAQSVARMSISDVSGETIRTQNFTRRPGVGQSGRVMRVRTNYLQIQRHHEGSIFQYDVNFTPEAPPAFLRKLFTAFEQAYVNTDAIGNAHPVFDGRKNMYSARPLPFGEAATFDVTEPDEEQGAGRRELKTYKMRVKRVAAMDVQPLKAFLHGDVPHAPYEVITAFDIVLRHKPSTQYVTVGRSFFVQAGAQSLNGGAEVWPGYHQSIRPAGNTLKINIDVSSTAFYEAGPLLRVVSKILNKSEADLSRPMQDRDIVRLEKTLKGLKVTVTHRGDLRKKFRIAKLGGPANTTMFDMNGTKISVADYFTSHYRALQKPNLPLLVVGDPSKGQFMPMEVCQVVPGQRHTRKLNERQTADMIRFTCQPPSSRASKIGQGITLLDYGDNKYMKEFDLEVGTDLCLIPARQLKAPRLYFGREGQTKMEDPRDGTWTYRDRKLAQAVPLSNWAVISFVNERDGPPQTLQKFIMELVRSCQEMGIEVRNPRPSIDYVNPAGQIENAIKVACHKAAGTPPVRPQLILCVLPNTGIPLYSEIKRVSDTVVGIPTQCVQFRHVSTAKRQYCSNVVLKMNVKMGGINTFVHFNELTAMQAEPTIVIGADVTHPSPTEGRKPSVASLVGSLDRSASKYVATVKVKRKEEIVNEYYAANNQLKPARIIYYRDGVSEGQFGEVLTEEVNAIRRACHKLEQNYRPKITYIVVQKRHHTRFFPMTKQDTDRSGNCLPGTVVDTDITHPTQFDFFLLSHPGLQGTSRPCHYHVLMDENGIGSDGIQDLSYKLSYMYARSTRAVSIVTPVYYAHLVSGRARYHTRQANQQWDTSESSAGSTGSDTAYAPVRESLQKYMLSYMYPRSTRAVSVVTPVYYAHLVSARARCHTRQANQQWGASNGSAGSTDGATAWASIRKSLQKCM
ncbi:eukaryotic translation initiation factor 2C, 2 [Quaeritorhiza haematococci]|nr:eukaryotic translation initiation factor 2C, 2 [Quaeritorhiza haematococci]